MIAPVSSEIGMNSAGEISPSFGLVQRTNASAPTIFRLTSSSTGWKSSRISPRISASESSRASERLRPARMGWLPSKKLQRSPPARLAAYIALSACRIASRASISAPLINAIPMLAVTSGEPTQSGGWRSPPAGERRAPPPGRDR